MRILSAFLLFSAAIIAASCGGSEKLEEASANMSIGIPLLTEPDKHQVGWGRSDCTSCHPFLPEEHPRLVKLPGYSADEACISCHLSNGTSKGKKIPECVFCHTNGAKGVEALAKRSAHSITRDRSNPYENPPTKSMSDIDCVICHDSANMDGKFTKDDLSDFGVWDRGELNDFCFACHSPNGATAQGLNIKYTDIKTSYILDYHGQIGYTDRGYGNDLIGGRTPNSPALSCLSCHTKHSSNNRKLFIESFSDGGAAVNVKLNNPSDLRDLCTRCHQNDGGESAPNGKKQTIKHDIKSGGWCFQSGCHPTNGHPVGAEYARTLMKQEYGGSGCTSCHRHGANAGATPNNLYPDGTENHSIF
ncbi:MAG: hypothetical protein LBP51_01865 [Deferribacteraceae bacterium]|jgi:hypothetical protein|nr:hypothetical protein [Deferribacteraceae bacterium]